MDIRADKSNPILDRVIYFGCSYKSEEDYDCNYVSIIEKIDDDLYISASLNETNMMLKVEDIDKLIEALQIAKKWYEPTPNSKGRTRAK